MIINEHPLISILLPVYNGEAFIGDSLKSILNQSYPHWELIVVDDGSKDESAHIVESFKDDRIILLKKSNTGMGDSLNQALALSKGDFIARQDADDISYPLRLEKQLSYMVKNQDTGLCGTWSKIINEKGLATGNWHKHPVNSTELKCDLFFDNPFVHSSVMFTKKAIADCGVYDTSVHSLVQDFDYWYRISLKFNVANIGEVLNEYRQVDSGISKSTSNFNEVVAKQSIVNINKVFPAGSQLNVEELAYVYHNVSMNKLHNTLIKSFTYLINKLVGKIVNEEKEVLKKAIIRKHVSVFCKHYYDQLINKKDNSLLKKVYYKISKELWSFKM